MSWLHRSHLGYDGWATMFSAIYYGWATASAAILPSMAGDNRWQQSAAPATRTNGCASVAPGLAGQLPSAAIELPPASHVALEDGSCNLSVSARR